MLSGQNKSTQKSGLTKDESSKLKAIIEELEKDERAFDFLEPVDYIKLGLEDYPKIVSKPMDLASVKVSSEFFYNLEKSKTG